MTSETKTYIHISQVGKDGKEDHFAQAKSVEKLVEKGEDFKQFSTLNYIESQFESAQEFMDAKTSDGSPVTDEVKKGIINRGWLLYQQVAARYIVLKDDADFVESTMEKHRSQQYEQ